MSYIIVDIERCKGCGLCVNACPRNIMSLDANTINSRGFNPAACIDEERCIGCSFCAMMCPDVCITVYKQESVCQET